MAVRATTHRRLNITLPAETVRLLKRVVPRSPYRSRSRFIDVAVRKLARSLGKRRLRTLLEEEARAHRDEDLRLVEEWAAVDAETWPDAKGRG